VYPEFPKSKSPIKPGAVQIPAQNPFIVGVFIWGPATLPAFKQRILAFTAALLGGFFAFFYTGTIGLTIGGGTRFAVQATGGLAVFVLILWWWYSDRAPIKPEDDIPPIEIKKIERSGSNGS